MNKITIYSDIKESVIRNFDFLKTYDFKKFTENQLAYEYHFKTNNNSVCIDIWFEMIYSSPIMVKINEYYIENIEPDNTVFKYYEKQRSEQYDGSDSEKLQINYEDNGKLINEFYLKECSEILRRNVEILKGNLEQLKSNAQKYIIKNELLITNERIKNKIYTLEYEIFSCEAFEEFPSLEKLKNYLVEQNHIKNYRILDWNMKEITIL